MKIVSGILILITLYLNLKHGWSGITQNLSEAETKMMSDLGITKTMVFWISIVSFLICVLILFPQTFFIGNMLNAFLILVIMGLALQTGNFRIALIEIPFLIMPLLMVYLGHPLKQ